MRGRRSPIIGQLLICKTFSRHGTQDLLKPRTIIRLALIKAKGLLFHIGVQVEWLNRYVGPLKGAFKQAPKVLHAIRVDVFTDIFNGVVNHLVDILASQGIEKEPGSAAALTAA